MRIALLTDSDAFAGTERHIHDLDQSLRALGVEVRVCCPSASPLARCVVASGGTFVAVEKGRGMDLAAIRAVARTLSSGEVDLVHAHNGRSALLAAAAKRYAGCGKLVLTQHFLEPAYVGRRGWRGTLSNIVHHWVDRQLDGVIAISDAVRQGVLDRGEMDACRTTTVHNGIRAPHPSRDAHTVRTSLGLDASSIFVLTAARLAPEKCIDVLIDAWRDVTRSIPDAVCLVAGVGDQRTTLQQRIDAAGVGACFRLLGFRDDVIELMAACDVFVLPSSAEPFGLALVEAMALHRCVIATDAGGPREIVQDGVSGLLVTPGDAQSLARAILSVTRDGALRDRFGKAARHRFLDHFQSERMARQVMDVYAKLLGQGTQQQARSFKI